MGSAFAAAVVGSAVSPVQLLVTILLLQSRSGLRAALGWIAGMTAVRLVQGLVFGLLLTPAAPGDGLGPVGSGVLLTAGVVLLAGAVHALVGGDDPDGPAARWFAAVDTVTPVRAFVLGGAFLLAGAKFWVFTLGAVAAVAGLPGWRADAAFVLFVVLAEVGHLVLVGLVLLAPARARTVLDRLAAGLQRHRRAIVVAAGAGFGLWFAGSALHALLAG